MAFLNTELFSRLILALRLAPLGGHLRGQLLGPLGLLLGASRWARCAAATPSAIWLTWSPFSFCSSCTNAARPIRVCAVLVVSSASGVLDPPFM